MLALTECLELDLETAGIDISVAAILPGPVASRIFESAGGVESGDRAASEAERAAMLQVKEVSMSALEAAEVVFAQGAAADFYLLTHLEMVGGAMAMRAEQLRTRSAPRLMTGDFDASAS
ncbi:hypothetical protein [Streptomyces antnestii]|uniref:hypothetical protein n=1 Tax=Streptomyces antnestii TaxID=2494256 RepID=UPI001CB91829|nr:hypothetical protein [Streptomyces sp. San01]